MVRDSGLGPAALRCHVWVLKQEAHGHVWIGESPSCSVENGEERRRPKEVSTGRGHREREGARREEWAADLVDVTSTVTGGLRPGDLSWQGLRALLSNISPHLGPAQQLFCLLPPSCLRDPPGSLSPGWRREF